MTTFNTHTDKINHIATFLIPSVETKEEMMNAISDIQEEIVSTKWISEAPSEEEVIEAIQSL